MMSCRPRGEGGAPLYFRALKLCRKLSEGSSVNINVEGTVATLKRETPLSAKTSKGKHIAFSQNKLYAAPGRDGPCSQRDVWSKGGSTHEACMLDGPKLNCTAASALCYQRDDCIAVDIGFGFASRGAVARLRFTL